MGAGSQGWRELGGSRVKVDEGVVNDGFPDLDERPPPLVVVQPLDREEYASVGLEEDEESPGHDLDDDPLYDEAAHDYQDQGSHDQPVEEPLVVLLQELTPLPRPHLHARGTPGEYKGAKEHRVKHSVMCMTVQCFIQC